MGAEAQPLRFRTLRLVEVSFDLVRGLLAGVFIGFAVCALLFTRVMCGHNLGYFFQ